MVGVVLTATEGVLINSNAIGLVKSNSTVGSGNSDVTGGREDVGSVNLNVAPAAVYGSRSVNIYATCTKCLNVVLVHRIVVGLPTKECCRSRSASCISINSNCWVCVGRADEV